MAYFFNSDNGPSYLTVIADMDKIKAASTETFEEYIKTNRFGMAPERIKNIGPVIDRSLTQGYTANVSRLYYHSIVKKNIGKMITKDKFLKYDALPSATIMIPIIKEEIASVFKDYGQEKVQILDVVITLQDGTELQDYRALNVVNRVEAFTWEGSVKSYDYEKHFNEYEIYLKNDFEWIPEPTRKNLI